MQDPRRMLTEEILRRNPKKQKLQRVSISQVPGDYMRGVQEPPFPFPSKTLQKMSRKSTKNEASPFYHQQQRSAAPEMQDLSTGNEYRALRRKYLVLEKESFGLGKELREVEDEIRALEDEKLTLLDQLIVLEGLVDPSELQHQ